MSSNGKRPLAHLQSLFGFHTPVPDVVIKLLPKIGPDGFALWCYFMFRIYNDKRREGDLACWPSWERMETDTGMSRRRIGKALQSLVDAHILSKRRRFSRSTVYQLHPPGTGSDHPQFPHCEGNSSLTVREPVPSGGGTNQDSLNQERKVNREKGPDDGPSLLPGAQRDSAQSADLASHLGRICRLAPSSKKVREAVQILERMHYAPADLLAYETDDDGLPIDSCKWSGRKHPWPSQVVQYLPEWMARREAPDD